MANKILQAKRQTTNDKRQMKDEKPKTKKR